jgi:hypothetical protein
MKLLEILNTVCSWFADIAALFTAISVFGACRRRNKLRSGIFSLLAIIGSLLTVLSSIGSHYTATLIDAEKEKQVEELGNQAVILQDKLRVSEASSSALATQTKVLEMQTEILQEKADCPDIHDLCQNGNVVAQWQDGIPPIITSTTINFPVLWNVTPTADVHEPFIFWVNERPIQIKLVSPLVVSDTYWFPGGGASGSRYAKDIVFQRM